MTDIPEIYDITTDARRPVTQEDIDRLSRLASVYALTRRVLLRMLNFPRFLPVTDDELKQHHALLEKVMSLIENGHIEAGNHDRG